MKKKIDTVSKFITDLNKRNDEYCRVVSENEKLHKHICAKCLIISEPRIACIDCDFKRKNK